MDEIEEYFNRSEKQLRLSAQRIRKKLSVSENMIDTMSEGQLRSWLRFMLKEYVKLEMEKETAAKLYRAEIAMWRGSSK